MGCQPKAMQLPANDDAFMHKSLPHCSTKALLLKKSFKAQRHQGRIDHKKYQRARETNALATLTFLHSIQDEQRTNKSAVARR